MPMPILITMGDPNGIGPEVVAKALADPPCPIERLVVVGSRPVLEKALRLVGVSLHLRTIPRLEDAGEGDGTVAVLDPEDFSPADLAPGQVSAKAGAASVNWVLLSGRLCLEGKAVGMATAPIHKEAAALAGYREVGHTELLAHLAGAPKVYTMLMTGRLRVVHLTTHRSLRRACDAVTQEAVLAAIRTTHAHFTRWGMPSARIAVAALNPHAGEGGLLGTEEIEHIAPAVAQAQKEGIACVGPLPADSVFYHAIQGRYDVVLAMYHDQGHIPVKVHGFERSVSVNLGLPFIRTSVDHGTAFDIAWQGKALATSMQEAIRTAFSLGVEGRLPLA
ncbi:MAG: 4-hydroxythreonine-4-phosphate dehydrogenase PdxA [Dehalococcoidia bacterium]|nr:4-hydroxythreonine-4-phosphate dehydrogenase PdxA [Dehalococcoidia bacterium]MDW8119313.1 4-hydroxythreonine-4-phosphate dehydrogenase PdxA [Chloroflexota bacterium]